MAMKRLIVLLLLLVLASFALADVFTIGTGTTTQNYVPNYGLYDYGWSKTIYTAAEMNAAGLTGASNLIAIGYEVGNTPANYTMLDQRVYIRQTNQGVYATADNTFPDNTQFTQVYQGDYTYNGGGWHYIMFSAPFAWDGNSNIEILWENWDGDWVSGYPNYRYTVTTEYKAVYKYADNTFPTTTGTLYYNRPNIQFVTPQLTPPNPAVLIYPVLNGYAFTNAVLSWQNGGGMPSTYDVYLGTTNPPTALVSQGQTGTSFAPANLQPGTTYFWKVIPYNTNGPAENCPVWSFKTGSGGQIAQSFDDTAFPPSGWSNPGTYTRSTTTPFHGTASAYKLAPVTPALLITPMVTITPESTLDFWVRTSATTGNGRIQIQYSSDLTNWTNVGDIIEVPTNTNWNSFSVNLGAIAGNSYYLAFASSSTTSTTAIYIDHVFGPNFIANDLAATQLTGNSIPSVNSATTYTLRVSNLGSAAQTNYTVKLYNGNNVELASAPGVAIQPGTTVDIPFTWTPTVEGPVALYAKVILTGDANPANDQSPTLNITVQPAGLNVVTIGEGGTNARMPLDFYYKNSLNQTMYYSTEIGMFGTITALALYNQFVTATLTNMPTKIWMTTTTQENLAAGWIPSTQMTLVFDGTMNYPAGENTITFPLTVPFAYTGGNLVVMFQRPMDTVYYSSSDFFKCQTVGTNRAWNVYSDSTIYDPAAPTGGTLGGQFAKTTLFMTPLSPDPMFIVNPASKNFGDVILGTSASQTFTVANAGGGSLGISNISISGSPMFSLVNVPTLPQSLTTGQTLNFGVTYAPTAAGTHTATISVTDNRTVHTINLTGNGVDTTIYTLPYQQGFDTVTVPALPVGWSSIYQATVTTGYVKTVTTSPQSTPNCVAMYNPTDANTIAMLIAPPLATNVPANTVRLKFWGKGATTYAVKVGVMTNPADAATFVELQTITLTASWAQYSIPLTAYTGAGRFIAFRHANNSTGQTIYLDTVEMELISPNDLAATLLSGNSTPSVNSATNYTVTVFNNGTAAQSTYTVKLYDGNNVELASTNGVAVNPGAQVDVSLSWTPTQQGAMSLYGKVILAGDANPANDQTPPLAIMVQPAGVITVTVGAGDQNARMPLDFFYKNSLYQTLYYPGEIGMYGNITTMSIYNQFTTATLTSKPTKIWMGTTTQADLSGGWIPSTQLTLVYDGSLAYPAGANTITFPLMAPFSYSNGNLVVMFNRPMDTAYFSSSDFFKCQTVGTNRARNIFSDSVVYDPAAPTGGTVTGQFPMTTFTMTALSDDPMFMVSPASHDFGDVNLGGSRSQTFNIMNIGGGTLGINNITISGSATFSLTNLPTLPASLTTGATAAFTVTYTPGSLGVTTATVNITDNLGNLRTIGIGDRQNLSRTVHTVALTGNGVNDLTVGAGDQNALWPLNFFYKNSLFETIYYPNELSNFTGMITGIKLYNSFVTNLPDMPTKIWLGTTTLPDLSTDWIPSTQLTLVFDGTVTYPTGQNVISINFPEPFMYLNGQNLVMMMYRPMDTQYFSSSDYFKNQTVGTNRTRRINSDSVTYDPAAPPTAAASQLSGQFPKTTFVVIPGGVGHITGTVLGAGSAPLQGVQVNVDNRPYSATTNAQGQFTIPNVLPGNYVVNFSKYGYVSQTQNIVLAEDETEVMNITMAQMAMVNVSGTILASDTGVGIAGASIHLAGYADYTGSSIGNGTFLINNVYANQSYSYVITAAGYASASGTINVAVTNHNMGNITVNEVAYAPNTVVAAVNGTYSAVNLTWNAPDPNAVEITESFEGTAFPPANWTRTVTNNGAPNAVGVFPTWCQFGAITISGTPVTPTDGSNQAGLWWSYEHQDEWLMTPSFNCPPGAYLKFDTYSHYGSTNDDHYYVKVSTNGGSTWDILWDASTLPASDNFYSFPVTVDLASYSGLPIKLAFHAVDPPTNDGLWYVWFIDNIYIGNMVTSIRFAGSDLTSRSSEPTQYVSYTSSTPNEPTRGTTRSGAAYTPATRAMTMPSRVSDRALVGYKIWRLIAGQEANESTWISITPETVTTLNHSDSGWNTLPNGTYKWAVKAVYTAGVLSAPAMSNPLVKEVVNGTIVGFVRRTNNQAIAGATVSAGGVNATTNAAGAYSLILPAGLYSVTATANNFHPVTINGVTVSPNQNTTLNFSMTPSANEDDVIPVLATTLAGNFPNPFNPETTISYSIKEPANVRLEVYNLRGQMVRSLVNIDQLTGHYRVVFDAKDDRGNPLSSGIYLYRLTAGSYTSTRKMMLME